MDSYTSGSSILFIVLFVLIFAHRYYILIFLFNCFCDLNLFRNSRIHLWFSINHFFFFLCVLFVSSIICTILYFIHLTLLFFICICMITFWNFSFFFNFKSFEIIKTSILINKFQSKKLLKSHSMIGRENQNFISNAIKISEIFIHYFDSFRSSSASAVMRVKSIIAMYVIPLNSLLLMYTFPENVFLSEHWIIVWN